MFLLCSWWDVWTDLSWAWMRRDWKWRWRWGRRWRTAFYWMAYAFGIWLLFLWFLFRNLLTLLNSNIISICSLLTLFIVIINFFLFFNIYLSSVIIETLKRFLIKANRLTFLTYNSCTIIYYWIIILIFWFLRINDNF